MKSLLPLAAATLAALGLSSAHAATYNWAGATTGLNLVWTDGFGLTPGVAGDTFNLNTVDWSTSGGGPTINPTAPTVTLGILNIGDTGPATSITINANSSTFILDNGASDAQINLQASSGTASVLSTPLRLASNLAVANANDFTLGSAGGITGYGNLSKSGAGQLTLNGTGSFTGNVSITQGILRMGSTSTFSAANSVSVTGTGSLQFDSNSAVRTIGGLTGSGGVSGNGTNEKRLTINNAVDNVYTGVINYAGGAGSGNQLNKAGAGKFTLSGAGDFNAGSGGASMNLSGGIFELNNATANNTDRITNTVTMTLNGGEFSLVGNGSADTTETVAALTLGVSRGSTITVANGSGRNAALTLASYAITAGVNTGNARTTEGGILFRGTNLGTGAVGTANVANILFTAAPTLIGGGGAANSATISILPSALGDTSATGLGAGLVTYDATNGIRLINTTTEVSAYGGGVTENQKIVAGGGITGQVVNSLLVDNGTGSSMTSTITGTLDITSNALVFGGANKSTIAGTAINFAADSSAYISVLSGATAEMAGATFTTASANGLVKQGAGTLILTGQVAGSSGYVVAAGTLKAGAANTVFRNTTSVGNVLTVLRGSTVDIAGFNQLPTNDSVITIGSGAVLTNTGANATFQTSGLYGATSTINGLITDGDGGDATSGRISLQVTKDGDPTTAQTLNITHGGHQLGSIAFGTGGSTQVDKLNMMSVTSTDSNDLSGSVTAYHGQQIFVDTTANVGTSAVAKTLGNATINLNALAGGGTITSAPTLTINSRAEGGPGLTSANILAWTNDVLIAPTGGSRFAAIKVGASAANTAANLQADVLSSGVTQQLGALSVGGLTTTLSVAANNGYTLEFTGATTLSHTAATVQTLEVTAGTLKLGAVGESGTGAKGLTKTGDGTLLITGAGTYTGDTAVTAGTLLVGNTVGSTASLAATGNVTVGTAGMLGGMGVVGGDTMVDGMLSPGASAGSLGFGGDLTLSSTAQTLFELGGTSFILNSIETYDRIKLTGEAPTLNLDGAFNVSLTDSFVLAANQAFGIFQLGTGAARVGTFDGLATDGSLVGNLGGQDLFITYSADFDDSGAISLAGGNDIALYTIPEPGTLAMLVLGFGLMIGFQAAARRGARPSAVSPDR